MSAEYYTNVPGAVSCSSSRWLTEEVFKLIDMVQRDEAIYNPRHKYYFCRPYVENFWREVDQKLEKNPGASLAKWTNLRISFRREYTNYLEEKVPPCWSYFDRMFFLHPYLRKKHQQPKSLDSQMQDALVRISSLSDRLQRERSLAAVNAAASLANGGVEGHSGLAGPQSHEHYLDYFDEAELNNSELDDIIDEEPPARAHAVDQQLLSNEIKSECDDNVDDYEPESHHNPPPQRLHDDEDNEAEDSAMRTFLLDTLAASSSTQDKRQQLRQLQQLNRSRATRSYHDELRSKRPRSHESISSTQALWTGHNYPSTSGAVAARTPTQSNVSFVRPTVAKPLTETVSTTSGSGNAAHAHSASGVESDLSLSQPAAPSQTATALQRHLLPAHHGHHHHHGHRLEIAAVSSGEHPSGSQTSNNPNGSVAGGSAAHLELCDCKTDPDAMFLMSLLPDIQKLNGRDRGKIKIAFQNILQDYLYPD